MTPQYVTALHLPAILQKQALLLNFSESSTNEIDGQQFFTPVTTYHVV